MKETPSYQSYDFKLKWSQFVISKIIFPQIEMEDKERRTYTFPSLQSKPRRAIIYITNAQRHK